MKELITKKDKSMLWQDEQGEPFLLLKWAEIFQISPTELRGHYWSTAKMAVLRKLGIIIHEMTTDDPLIIFTFKMAALPQLLQWGRFKRRPNLKGSWIKDKEKRLAHKILPYNPKYLEARNESRAIPTHQESMA